MAERKRMISLTVSKFWTSVRFSFVVFCVFFLQCIPAKPRYSLINDKADLEFYNKSAGRDVTFSFKQINSVQFALSAAFTTLQEFGDAVSVEAKVYKMQGDAYKLIPFNVKSNVCKIWKSNMLGFSSLAKYGNITGCGIKANTHYYIKDYMPELDKFPPMIPMGGYKLDIEFWRDTDKWHLFILKWYARVLPPVKDEKA